MKIWHFDPAQENMLMHTGESYADPDPMAEGQWLLPAHTCTVPPLPDQDGKTQHYDTVSSVWYYKDMPQPAPEVPLDPKEIRRAEILGQLATIDADSVRPAREVAAALATGEPAPQFATTKLVQLEAEAAGLRAELARLGAV